MNGEGYQILYDILEEYQIMNQYLRELNGNLERIVSVLSKMEVRL